MKTFNKIKKFSGYLDYNIEEAVLNLSHENGYIKPRKTFWRNSKQLLG